MRTQQERAILTGQELIQHLGWPPPKARQELGRLEGDLARAFEGQVLTGALKASVLELAQARIPAPEGYRWRVEASQEGGRTVLFTWLDGSARDQGIPEGYRWAARVITGYDGGNHELADDLCGSVVIPDGHEAHTRSHATLLHPVAADVRLVPEAVDRPRSTG